jgi:arylsulfatase A-like enzyme
MLAGGLTASAIAAPNFILILTDDQGWSDTAPLRTGTSAPSGDSYFETPNLDRLAHVGMRFTQAYAPSPICTPSRRAILTGQSTARLRGSGFRSSTDGTGFATIPSLLKSINPEYRSAHFGKWGEFMGISPEGAGYDLSDGRTGNDEGFLAKGKEKYAVQVVGPDGDPKKIDSITKSAIDFMQTSAQENRPFFVQLSHYAIHLSPQVRQEILDAYLAKPAPDRAVTPALAGMVQELDVGLGEILKAVKTLGLSEETFLIFSSDNGGQERLSEKPIPTKTSSLARNAPLRGGKHSLYEGGLRVPLLIVGPGIPSDSSCDTPVALYDLLPTLADLAGGRDKIPSYVDGGSLKPLFQNPGAEVQRPFPGLVFHRPFPHYVESLGAGVSRSAMRKGAYKLIVDWAHDDLELYNVSEDPGESKNLADQEPGKDTAQSLFLELSDYLFAVNAERPTTTPSAELQIAPGHSLNQKDLPTYYSEWERPETSGGSVLPPWSKSPSRVELEIAPARWEGFIFRVFNHELSRKITGVTLQTTGARFRKFQNGNTLRSDFKEGSSDALPGTVRLTFDPPLAPGQADVSPQFPKGNAMNGAPQSITATIEFDDGTTATVPLVRRQIVNDPPKRLIWSAEISE